MISNLILLKRGQINEKILDEKTVSYLSMVLEESFFKVFRYTAHLVFLEHKYYHYYTERIAKLNKIDVNSRNNTFSIFVPVNNHLEDEDHDKKIECISIDNLPIFYKENNLKYVKN